MSNARSNSEREDPFTRLARLEGDLLGGLHLRGIDDAEDEVVRSAQASVHRFANECLDSPAIDRSGTIPRAAIDAAAALGLFGLMVPAEHGGSGMSLSAASAVVGTVAEHDRSVATMIGLHNGLGLLGLVRHANEGLRRRHLRALATGEQIAAFAATEAGAGSDLTRMRTRLSQDPVDTDRLRVDGEKILITNAHLASVFTVVAASPSFGGRKRGMTLVLVPASTPGLSVGREEDKLGLRGSSTATVRLDAVSVPIENIIGEPGHGATTLGRLLSSGRVMLAAGSLGAARCALRLSVAHASTREQFGRPLAELELVRRQLASMSTRLFAAESVAAAAAYLAHRDDEACAWETAAAKVLCSEIGWSVADDALQLHGGMGFVEDTGIARVLRDSRAARIFEGANDVLWIHLGAQVVSWPLRLLTAVQPLAERVAPPLRDAARLVDGRLADLVLVVGRLREAHGLALIQRQSSLVAASALALAVYVARVSLLRAEAFVRAEGPTSPAVDRALGACADSETAYVTALRSLDDDAALAERIARRALEPRSELGNAG